MAIRDEWDDMMPHRIKVVSKSGRNVYGRPVQDLNTARVYRCLFDSTETITRTAQGVEVSVGLTAYAKGTPENIDGWVRIEESDTVTILGPEEGGVTQELTRPVISVAHHFDQDGSLHNQTIRFS